MFVLVALLHAALPLQAVPADSLDVVAAPEAPGYEAPPPEAALPEAALPEAAASEAEASQPRPPDARADEEPGIDVRPRLAPSALYSENRGFGIGAGVGVRNLLWTGTDLTFDLRLQQQQQGAALTFFTHDPYSTRLHGLVSVSGFTTERRRYFGLGPDTDTDDELSLFRDAAQVEARLGWYPLDSSVLYVQPGIRYLRDASAGVNEDASDGSLEALDPASQAAVTSAGGDTRHGLSLGLEVATDLRDWPSYPTEGVYAAVEYRRFVALDGSDLSLDHYSGSWIGYLPLNGRTALVGRGVGALTRSGDGDGDGVSDPIPFFYLPTLDAGLATPYQRDRLTGRDVVAFGAGVRLPVVDALGVYGLDALLMGFVGNAYDDVFEQFEPRLSFRDTVDPSENGRAPLRPSLAIGLGIVNLDKERVVLGGLLGVGPGGITAATLRVAYDLRDARPLFR